MREKEEEDNTQQRVFLIYTMFPTHMRTHTHAAHICTHTDFSHPTGPRTDTPSKAGHSRTKCRPSRRPFPAPKSKNQLNLPNTGIQQPNPNLPSTEGSKRCAVPKRCSVPDPSKRRKLRHVRKVGVDFNFRF